jgi:hypothetical protein
LGIDAARLPEGRCRSKTKSELFPPLTQAFTVKATNETIFYPSFWIAAEFPKVMSQTKSLHASKSHYRQTQQQNEHPENSSNPWVALNMVDRLRV